MPFTKGRGIMTRQEQLMEYIIQDIVEYISNDRKIPFEEAMKSLYSSEVFHHLSDVETGLYRESSAYVYALYLDEMKDGCMIQNEI